MTKEELLKLVEDYISNEPKKNWRPGKDHVHYAGPYFDHKEIVRSVSTLLDGWLVLGSEAYKAEKKLATLFGKNHALLTNSGSSSNLLMMSALKSKRYLNLPEGTKVLTHEIQIIEHSIDQLQKLSLKYNPIVDKASKPIQISKSTHFFILFGFANGLFLAVFIIFIKNTLRRKEALKLLSKIKKI